MLDYISVRLRMGDTKNTKKPIDAGKEENKGGLK